MDAVKMYMENIDEYINDENRIVSIIFPCTLLCLNSRGSNINIILFLIMVLKEAKKY